MGSYGEKTLLSAELVMELSVKIAPPLLIGSTKKGYQKVIPITGGSFSGQQLRGEVIPGGADWNTTYGCDPESADALRHIFAKYTLQTEDGICIGVENEGWKTADSIHTTQIVTTPKFQVSAPQYDWLNYGVFVGSLSPVADAVEPTMSIRIYRMN